MKRMGGSPPGGAEQGRRLPLRGAVEGVPNLDSISYTGPAHSSTCSPSRCYCPWLFCSVSDALTPRTRLAAPPALANS